VYDRAHVTWRAGAISDWYYGKRSPSDPTVVWLVDGIEYDGRDHAGVGGAIDRAFARAGIASASFGAAWCGYRSLEVTYGDGSRLTERYDSTTCRVVLDRSDVSDVPTSEAA
jgi:hypothetical protein